MGKIFKNKRSNVLVDGSPKKPTAAQLAEGEIAINYHKDYETIFIKNSEGEIVSMRLYNELPDILETINGHTSNTSNPHHLTKEQVGLILVDNTSDANKPVSTPQQQAVDLKLNKTDVVNNLTTNDSTKALSAAQGLLLNTKLDTVSSGAAQDLSALLARVSSLEEEVNSTEARCDAIIAKEDTIYAEFNV